MVDRSSAVGNPPADTSRRLNSIEVLHTIRFGLDYFVCNFALICLQVPTSSYIASQLSFRLRLMAAFTFVLGCFSASFLLTRVGRVFGYNMGEWELIFHLGPVVYPLAVCISLAIYAAFPDMFLRSSFALAASASAGIIGVSSILSPFGNIAKIWKVKGMKKKDFLFLCSIIWVCFGLTGPVLSYAFDTRNRTGWRRGCRLGALLSLLVWLVNLAFYTRRPNLLGELQHDEKILSASEYTELDRNEKEIV